MSCLRANPLTGEMIDGDVIFDASWIRYWKQEYAFLTGHAPPTAASGDQATGEPLAMGQVISPIMAAKQGFGLNLPVPPRNRFLDPDRQSSPPAQAVPAEANPLLTHLRRRQASGLFTGCQYCFGMRPEMALAAIRTDAPIDDAEQIIEAIRSGCVDAFVVEEREGHTVYTLQGADLPYSALVQKMQQGAAMLDSGGDIIYCNPSLTALLAIPGDAMVGLALRDFIHPDDRNAFDDLLNKVQVAAVEGELRLSKAESVIPVKVSLSNLARDKSVIGVLVTDLTTERAHAELASRIQSVQDQERRSLARELHDSVGQLLAAIAMNLNRFRTESGKRDPDQMALIEDSAMMLDQVSKEIRTISHLLHPPLLDVAGLASAIRWYVDGFSERSKINVKVEIPSDCGRLSNEAEIAIFRVVQECLTNVYRHSGAQSCSVTLLREPDRLKVEIRDQGRGMPKRNFGTGQSSSGLGLRGMQERLRQLGGTLEFSSSEQGTVVTASVPLTD